RLGCGLGHAVRLQHGDGRAASRQGAQGSARFRDRPPPRRDHGDPPGVQRAHARAAPHNDWVLPARRTSRRRPRRRQPARQPPRIRFDLSGMEVVPRVLLPLPRRARHAYRAPQRPRSAVGAEQGREGLPPRLVRIHGAERPRRQGDAGVEGAARHRRRKGAVPVCEGAERRLAQAGAAAPRIGLEEESVTRAVVGAALASIAVGSVVVAAAQQRLTREQVLAAIGAATPQAPADFTGKDLSGLDLSGVDFKRANLSRCQLVKTSLVKAQLFSVTLSDAIATDADFTGAKLDASVMYRVDMRRAVLRVASLFAVVDSDANLTDADVTGADLSGAILRSIRGRDRIRGLDKAIHADQAIFND